MVSALLAANTALIVELMRERGMSPIQVIYLLAVPTNVLTLGAGVMYGLNDAFVAALLMVAVIFRHRRYCRGACGFGGAHQLLSASAITVFRARWKARLRWSVIVGGIAVFCIGMIAYNVVEGFGVLDQTRSSLEFI
jgi:hypothetical protein